ncbi:gamma-aminobutyric acid A receptor [Arthroderma uncinatum]|uniref:gamma-aminobutyric acid A receptor n=1 Tax=Arthroderma uncinatum TaxID=74035 RepID=UPI00144AEE55|nr:gamma-aminobutyric acid A receptor [Arthroderma uncinatum]KAF3480639.1 gamma-aminobutyric acid A receptor [Arthroderma uncinatum]
MSAPTGVRGLLAKFENNNVSNASTSPPSRGRSPAGSDHSSTARPLSKVRASFVAVERSIPGSSGSPLLGLKRVGEAGDYFSAPRSVADDMGSPIDRNATRTPVENLEKMSPRKWGTPQRQNNLNEVVSPRKTSDPIVSNIDSGKVTLGGKSKPGLGVILKGSPFEDSSAPPSPAKGQSARQAAMQVKKAPAEDKQNGKPKTAAVSKNNSQRAANNTTEKSSNNRPAPKSSVTGSKSSSASKPAKAPATTAKETAQSQTITATKKLNKVLQEPASKPATTTSGSSSSRPKQPESKTASQTAKSTPNLKNGGPKSPTRPSRIHPAVLAPTASSAAKTPNAPPSRPSSRTSAATTAATNTKALNRKPSTLRPTTTAASRTTATSKPPATTTTVRKQGSRASLAPQHTSSGHDRPTSRSSILSSRPVDDSSLARLIRPTASSANKRQDKMDIVSPPRLAAKPPARKSSDKGAPAAHTGSPVRVKSSRPPVRTASEEHVKQAAPAPEIVTPKLAEPVVAEAKPVEPEVQDAEVEAPAPVEPLEVKSEAQPETQPETQPEETPEEVHAEGVQPIEAKPEEIQPEVQPEEVKLVEEAPSEEETKPDEAQPEEVQPEESQPEESQPEESQPEESQPEEPLPKEAEPVEVQPVATPAVEV